MCDADLDYQTIVWEGWNTTLSFLGNAGWVISSRKKYEKSAKSNYYIYIRHPVLKLVGKIEDGKVLFLIPEKTLRIKPPRFTDERECTEDDIIPMLQVIASLQPTAVRKKLEPTQADILEFMKLRA